MKSERRNSKNCQHSGGGFYLYSICTSKIDHCSSNDVAIFSLRKVYPVERNTHLSFHFPADNDDDGVCAAANVIFQWNCFDCHKFRIIYAWNRSTSNSSNINEKLQPLESNSSFSIDKVSATRMSRLKIFIYILFSELSEILNLQIIFIRFLVLRLICVVLSSSDSLFFLLEYSISQKYGFVPWQR